MNNMRKKYQLEELRELAKPFTKRSQLRKEHNAAYQAACTMGVLDDICSHMEPSATARIPDQILIDAASKYIRKTDFREKEQSLYDIAYRRGILNDICSHMEDGILRGENNPNFKWSKKAITKLAAPFTNKLEFLKAEPNAYQAAFLKGWLEEICSHMDQKKYWKFEEAKKVALKYIYISDFMAHDYGAYQYAQREGFLEEFCSHMKPSKQSSKPERDILAIIRSIFSSAKTLRDRNVSIENKPYMCGFHIDIFIPELNLGIEFDGTRYHSFEYMRKDKRKAKWSDDDIHNYHEIKDAWFATKGISIIHIKEEEWLEDKQACIDKCLAFLGLEQKKVA
jgi:hypothetical protein